LKLGWARVSLGNGKNDSEPRKWRQIGKNEIFMNFFKEMRVFEVF